MEDGGSAHFASRSEDVFSVISATYFLEEGLDRLAAGASCSSSASRLDEWKSAMNINFRFGGEGAGNGTKWQDFPSKAMTSRMARG